MSDKDTIYRQAAVDAVGNMLRRKFGIGGDLAEITLAGLPSAQPEITDEQAIEHLQSTGWMQNHDREMYESGLREQLADDSGSYNSLVPCEDTISREEAIDAIDEIETEVAEGFGFQYEKWRKHFCEMPSAQPEPHYDEWCTDCKEYDKERHCCPRWNRVIKQTLKDAQPERKKGAWLMDGEKCGELMWRCSECRVSEAVPTATSFISGIAYPQWKFCPNCGSYNGGEQYEP